MRRVSIAILNFDLPERVSAAVVMVSATVSEWLLSGSKSGQAEVGYLRHGRQNAVAPRLG